MSGNGGGGSGNGGASGAGAEPGTSLLDRITVSDVTAPEGAKPGVRNWRIWRSVAFRVAPIYTAPLANCGTLVCITTGTNDAPTPRVLRLGPDDALIDARALDAGRECRGIAAEPDGHYAVLLFDNAGDRITMKRFDAAGTENWTRELVNADNKPTDFGIGDSRMEFGNGKYGAYYHVHSDSGHEGDTLKWVDAAAGTESTEWGWGCSHSMSNVLRFNANAGAFLPACVTDCYPGTSGDFATDSVGGIYLNHDDGKVMDIDAGCNGSVAAELGSAAAAPSGHKLVFNAHQNPMTRGQASYDADTMNQDIGFSSISGSFDASPVVWLTSTADADEADSSIARWQPAGESAEQYVVGWREAPASYKLAVVDAAGAFVAQPIEVGARAKWGERDDPFREHYDGDVVWAWFDAAGSTTLHFARLRSGKSHECAAF